MVTSLAESQTDSYFPTKWLNGYPKQKDVSDTHIQRRTITKINSYVAYEAVYTPSTDLKQYLIFKVTRMGSMIPKEIKM